MFLYNVEYHMIRLSEILSCILSYKTFGNWCNTYFVWMIFHRLRKKRTHKPIAPHHRAFTSYILNCLYRDTITSWLYVYRIFFFFFKLHCIIARLLWTGICGYFDIALSFSDHPCNLNILPSHHFTESLPATYNT